MILVSRQKQRPDPVSVFSFPETCLHFCLFKSKHVSEVSSYKYLVLKKVKTFTSIKTKKFKSTFTQLSEIHKNPRSVERDLNASQKELNASMASPSKQQSDAFEKNSSIELAII